MHTGRFQSGFHLFKGGLEEEFTEFFLYDCIARAFDIKIHETSLAKELDCTEETATLHSGSCC